MNKKNKWYKLDNAAKIFPPTTDKKDPNVFRFSCELFDIIDPIILQESLDITLKEYPVFLSVLKKGLFWYYLEATNLVAKVSEENMPLCHILKNGLLFRVSYYKNRINLEVYHALTDGTGTLQFLKSMVCHYLKIKYKMENFIKLDDTSLEGKSIDSFNKYYNKNEPKKFLQKIPAYRIRGSRYPEEQLKIIEGIVSTKKILEISKENDTTVTAYLVSVLIKSIGETMTERERKKSIVITVPVNLRKYFPSNTVRNFFNIVSIKYKYNEQELETIIKDIHKQLKENLDKKQLKERINSFEYYENLFIFRLIPLFIKDIVLKYSYRIMRKYQTMTLSNVGIVKIPEEFEKYIKLFDVFASTDTIQICMCSYKDNMVISFTSHMINTEIQKNFFRELSNKIDVQINTNIIEEEEYYE